MSIDKKNKELEKLKCSENGEYAYLYRNDSIRLDGEFSVKDLKEIIEILEDGDV